MVEFPLGKGFPDITAQKSQIQERLKSEYMNEGQIWYLLDAKWFKSFKYFVGIDGYDRSDTACNPGPIDNSLLCKENTTDLKPDLVEGLDYVPVSGPVWSLLHSWYGLKDNQAPIERKVINIARPPKYETKLEVYKVRLNIYSSAETETFSVMWFSQADKIAKIEEVSRKLFALHEDAKVQVRCFYGPNQSQVLSPENTVYEESLNNDLKIVIESMFPKPVVPKNKEQVARRCNARATSNNNRSMVGSGMMTRHGANSASGSAEGRGPPCTPGLSGLMNLGNTCFLNSIIQCLSNCGPLTQYFLDGKHEPDINATNPLGRAGKIATSYSDVLGVIWSGKYSNTVPHYFKLQLTKFAPQFAGCQQHDAQELLTFLLDGLHEDLNRIKDKPYLQCEENDQDDDQTLARKSWEYFLQRNDSIIIENFHGMLKSRVVCPDCETVSIKFDTFSTLSLPLPLHCDRTVLVRYVPYDQSHKVKDLLVVVPKKGLIYDLMEELHKVTEVQPEHMVIAEVNKSHFHKFFSLADPLERIDDRDKIYMFNLPEDMVEDRDTHHTVLPVVLWEVQDHRNVHFLSGLFGTPFLLMLPRGKMFYKALYDRICERLKRSCAGFLSANKSHSSFSMDIECTEEVNNNLFTPVLVNTFQYEEVQKIQDDDDHMFEVPDSFGRMLLALQVSRQVRFQFYKDPPVIQENHTNVFRPKPKPSLEDCLALFTTTEKLGENNAWHCPKCNMKKRATKKLDLWKLPNILVFHLKRFAFNETRKEKLDAKVEFPLTGLNIDHYVVNKHKENLVYDLIGVCNHYGSLMGGHYTATCKSYRDGNWYCFDDNTVTPVSPESVVSESAYVLFYQRRPETKPDQGKADV